MSTLVGLSAPSGTERSYVQLVGGGGTVDIKVLMSDIASSVTSDSAFDPKNEVHYVFGRTADFRFQGQKNTSRMYIDLDSCTGGGSCVNEWQWDTLNNLILAVGMGINNTNRLVQIIPAGKIVSLSATFLYDCGLFEGSVTFNPSAGGTFFVILDCHGVQRAMLYAFELTTGKRSIVISELNPPEHLVYAPIMGVFGFTYDETSRCSKLVSTAANSTTSLCNGIPGIIRPHTVSVSSGKLFAMSLTQNSTLLVEVELSTARFTVTGLVDPVYEVKIFV
jgi:hypothetical protein